MGGDLKTALSPNLNLDLTVNTDFAETEADDQRVNLTRFPLFYPERRAFFIERAGTFEVKTGELDLLPGAAPVFTSSTSRASWHSPSSRRCWAVRARSGRDRQARSR